MKIEDLIKEYWGLDNTSPTGLVFIQKRRGSKFKIGDVACNCINKRGYYVGMLGGKLMLAHRVVFFLQHNFWPIEVDHIDGNPLNNKISNLRAVTSSENSHNTLGRGYYLHKQTGKYNAYIKIRGMRKSLGLFATSQEARSAYLRAKRELHPTAPGRCYA